ncbi:unnamed protein product [Symbiodinium natans]|uniref:Uncharacterized protein n=1 Tax=Symbiodinium natans TaxID=878477 RepID=A0A812K011_9DINO|nr:unnamed protein product [Symbiodinium natans]
MAAFRSTWSAVLLQSILLGLRHVVAEEVCEHGATSSALLQYGHVTVVHTTSAALVVNSTNSTNGSLIIAGVDACLKERMLDASGDPEELQRWDMVREAEILARLGRAGVRAEGWPRDPEVIRAAKVFWLISVAGQDAAEAIVRKEFEERTLATLSSANLSEEAIQRFTETIQQMAVMCGKEEAGNETSQKESDILHENFTDEESRVAMEIATYAAGLCKSQALDLDFFTDHFGSSADCAEMISGPRLVQLNKFARKLEYLAKTILVLHDAHNQLGHHLSRQLSSRASFSELSISKPLSDALAHYANTRTTRMSMGFRLIPTANPTFSSRERMENIGSAKARKSRPMSSASAWISSRPSCAMPSHSAESAVAVLFALCM